MTSYDVRAVTTLAQLAVAIVVGALVLYSALHPQDAAIVFYGSFVAYCEWVGRLLS